MLLDQYFGHKELYEVVLKAKTNMQFGSRIIEEGEPVLYFENVNMSLLSETNNPVFARGGWANMPRVIWDNRSEVEFQMIEGVMSSIGMGILLGSNVGINGHDNPIEVHKKEGPFELTELTIDGKVERGFYISHLPIPFPRRKTFILEYTRKAVQSKYYGKIIERQALSKLYFVSVYQDKDLTIPADMNKQFVVDYYYEYGEEALTYNVQKERFNGLFTLEGKFYSKDENKGQNYTNLIYMPKVRVVSDINLRLGERADPTVSTFNIIGLPEKSGNIQNLILEITRLGQDIDGEL